MLACEEKIQPLINQAKDRVDKLFQDFENALDSINSNILTLQEYRNFPFELYEWIHVTDRYLAEIASLLNNFFGYVSYRMLSNANRFSSYVDAIILIMNVIQTYQVLIDFSANRSSKCATCTNDTYDQHSCTLSILCQGIKLPIIQIPNFKIPDIILDFSELNLNLDIILPNFNFQPVKIDLPQIPNIPSPPTLQLNIDLTLPNFPSLPAIPELPPPPHLPELPSFIPNIKLELPILPPAPALPEIPHTFEATLKFAEKIGRIYCIIKQGIGLVGEGEVKAKIEQLTERTYEVPRIDKILDLTNLLDFSSLSIKANGFDYEIDAQTNMQFNFSVISDFLDTLTKNINNLSTSVVSAINEGTQAVEAITNDAANIAQDCINDPTKCQDTAEQGRNNIEQKRDNAGENVGEAGENVEEARKNLLGLTSDEITYTDYPQARNRLETVLTYFANEAQQDEATSQKLQNIQNLLHTPSNIQANQQGITTIQQQITQLIHTEQEKIQLAQTTLTQDYDQLLTTLAATSSLTAPSEQKQLAFNLNRFTADTATKQLLTTMEHPYKILLDNKAPIIE
ncbi:MAG: hypothetical protein LBG59_02650 [Candidatus Peribacteria bacterium]|jgi:hypothetical protein|nr:hypothetical protein [Candidatus Peribacteria bacterium]